MKGEAEEEEGVTLPFSKCPAIDDDPRFYPRLFATVLIIQRPRARHSLTKERRNRQNALNQCQESIRDLYQTTRHLEIIRESDSTFRPSSTTRFGRMNVGYFWFYSVVTTVEYNRFDKKILQSGSSWYSVIS